MPRSHKIRVEWFLDIYARFFFTKAKIEGEWEQYDDRHTPLTITLTQLHDLVIAQDTTVLESFHLPSSKDCIRGMARADSLLVLYKCQGNTRRFRIRFKSSDGKTGPAMCDECVDKLSNYFLIKKGAPRKQGATCDVVTVTGTSATDASQGTTAKTAPGGTSLAVDHKFQKESTKSTESVVETAQNMMSTSNTCLSQQSYQNVSASLEATDISYLLSLCLSDANFPAFVANVEKALDDVMKTSTSIEAMES